MINLLGVENCSVSEGDCRRLRGLRKKQKQKQNTVIWAMPRAYDLIGLRWDIGVF